MVTIVSFDTSAQISRSHIPLMAEEYLNSYNALTDKTHLKTLQLEMEIGGTDSRQLC